MTEDEEHVIFILFHGYKRFRTCAFFCFERIVKIFKMTYFCVIVRKKHIKIKI